MVDEIFEESGTIQAISNKPKNYSVLVNKEWYSGWNNEKPEGLAKGDNISFKWQQNGNFKNIIGSPVIISVASPSVVKPETKEETFVTGDKVKVPFVDRDTQIRIDIRKQSALKSACSYMGGFAVNTGDDVAIAGRIIALAREFESYLAGN